MTGFGRGHAESPLGRCSVEVHSLNRRFLEVLVKLPAPLLALEMSVKKVLSSEVFRGKLSVQVDWVFAEGALGEMKPNLALLKAIKQGVEEVAQALGVEADLPLSYYLEQEGVLAEGMGSLDEEAFKGPLLEAVQEALTTLIKSKVQEGAALKEDLHQRAKTCEELLLQIPTLAEGSVEKQRKKIKEKLELLLGESVEQEERIYREIALIAERMDIMEEITRFKTHLEALHAILDAKDVVKGKSMEFLLQELNREVNTIASKAGEVKISQIAVEIKGELERMREQVQNVE